MELRAFLKYDLNDSMKKSSFEMSLLLLIVISYIGFGY